MNWLGHVFVAGGDPEDQIGGVLADVLSMAGSAHLGAGLQRGMALHRAIDAFGDAHPAFVESCRRLARADVGLRSLACGIAVDVLYDHLLAVQWERWCPAVTLPEFAAGFYRTAISRSAELPPMAQQVFTYMQAEDWLGSYRELDGVHLALTRIRRRLSPRAARQSPLPAAVAAFCADRDGFETDFAAFLPDVQAHAAAFLASRQAARKATFAVARNLAAD